MLKLHSLLFFALMAQMITQTCLANKISPYLLDQFSKRRGTLPVLVYLKEEANLDQVDLSKTKVERTRQVYDLLRTVALSSQKDLVSFLQQRRASYKQFYISNMIAIYDVDQTFAETLAKREDVARIEGNPQVRLSLPSPSREDPIEIEAIEGGIVQTGASQVWKELGIKGKGIVVSGQDTGVQWDHPALLKHYRGYKGAGVAVDHNYNWHDATRNVATPLDDNGHGTHTMGTIVGDDEKGNQIGMAPEATWITCKNMDEGIGQPSTYIECFEFFLAPYPVGGNSMTDGKPEMAPDVMNNSWGCPKSEGCSGTEFEGSLKALEKAGVMVVVSAGNEGPNCSTISDPPAWNTPYVLSVGAANHRNGEIAYFSSRGPSAFDGAIGPHLSAPGVGIRSAVPNNGYEGGWNGTSMAGPHVAGGVALLWQAHPELIGQIAKTREILMKSSTPKTSSQSCGNVSGSAIPNNTYGYGLFNIYKAIKSL